MRGGCFFLEGKVLTGDAGMRDGGVFFQSGGWKNDRRWNTEIVRPWMRALIKKWPGDEIRNYAVPVFSKKGSGWIHSLFYLIALKIVSFNISKFFLYFVISNLIFLVIGIINIAPAKCVVVDRISVFCYINLIL